MIDTEAMRRMAKDLDGHDFDVSAGMLRAAADEIDAGRNARLVQYRCAWADILANGTWARGRTNREIALAAEDMAHEQLAAERAPEVKP